MENKTGKYLKYAIGEIILVVIGILIALQINNWNENRKMDNRLLNIYGLIYIDIENDLADLKSNLEFYKQQKPVFDKVLHDSITPELLDQGLSRLLASGVNTTLNKTGVNQLKELQNKDSLTLKTINIYDLMETNLLDQENSITSQVNEHSIFIRDNYNWYAEWINKTIMKDNSSPELQAYFIKNIEYRNRVIFMYQLLFNNYIPSLEYGINYLTDLKSEIENILQESD
jgi:hypothetical protein